MRPSLYNLLIFRRELAKAISLLSFGSNHIFRRPHFNTDEANRFCNFKETEIMSRKNWSKNEKNKGSEHCSVQIYSLQRCMNENDREISVIWKQRHEKNAFPPKGTKGVRCLRWSLHSIHTTTSATLQQLFDTTKKCTHQSAAVITYYPYCWWFNLSIYICLFPNVESSQRFESRTTIRRAVFVVVAVVVCVEDGQTM